MLLNNLCITTSLANFREVLRLESHSFSDFFFLATLGFEANPTPRLLGLCQVNQIIKKNSYTGSNN